MEKGQEFLAKIMNREKDFLISKKLIVIGREVSSTLTDDIKGFIQNSVDLSGDLERINITDEQKVSKLAGLIAFIEKKRVFKYTNLSKNIQLVNNKILHKFESTKLKNKTEICIGNEMFFFVYSKALLISYYKFKLERLAKNKEKNGHIGTISKMFPVNQNQSSNNNLTQKEVSSSNIIIQTKTNPRKKKPVRKNNEQNGNLSHNISYAFDNMLKPPISSNMYPGENENILDDIIESKVKITNNNHKSILINEKDNK